jgi:hypothetical protein
VVTCMLVPSHDFRSLDARFALTRDDKGLTLTSFFITYNKQAPLLAQRSFGARFRTYYFVRPDLSARSTAKAGGQDDRGDCVRSGGGR